MEARRQARDQERDQRRAERVRRRAAGGKDNVVTFRLDDHDLDALDALVEAGVRTTRSDAAAWLIKVGLEVNRPLLDEVATTVADIRRLRAEAMQKARRFTGVDPDRPDT